MPWGRLSMDPPVKPEDDNVKFLTGMTIRAKKAGFITRLFFIDN